MVIFYMLGENKMKKNNEIESGTACLIDELVRESPARSLDIVKAAIQFALENHEGQYRAGGEPQINHALRVAIAAAKYARVLSYTNLVTPSMEQILICGSVNHDVLEDTEITDEEFCEQFSKEPCYKELGRELTRAVRAVSHEEEEEPDEVYLSRVEAGGMLAILIKRFDRLDNLQTLIRGTASEFRAQKLAGTSNEFATRKLSEVRMALPIWRRIDPEGSHQIEETLISMEAKNFELNLRQKEWPDLILVLAAVQLTVLFFKQRKLLAFRLRCWLQ